MKKKVLIISYSYPPSNVPAAQRPYTVAKYLDKDIFDVTVITCGNPDKYWGEDVGFDPELPHVNLVKVNSLLGGGVALRVDAKAKNSGVKSRIKSTLLKMFSSLVIPDKAIFWYPKVRKYINAHPELLRMTDIVFTTSPSFTGHLIGRYIKTKNRKVRWIAELRDFHFIETVQRATNFKEKANRNLERSVLKNADKVSFISYAMRDVYSKHFGDLKDKFEVVYNGLDVSDFDNLEIKTTQNSKLVIFYAGNFYRGVRSPIPLLRILDQLCERDLLSVDEVEVRIAGNFDEELIAEMKEYASFSAINFIGSIPRSSVLFHLVSVDLLWLIVGSRTTHYTGVPIKFFEYLGARRPIINFAPEKSEPTRLIKQHDLGWNFDTDNFDLDESVRSFEEIIAKFRSGELTNSLPEKSFKEFDRQHQGLLFGELFLSS